MTLPWTNDAPPPDLRFLSDADLVRVWRANRSGVAGANTVLGAVAAEEICKRFDQETKR